MQKLALVILAAGMGSRYGGLKQIEPVGPSGETIGDYSIYDALRAGFGKLVFVIRRDIERPFREIVGSRFEGRTEVEYTFQELNKLPPGFTAPLARQKPWGTGQAVLVAQEAVQEPFAVINADDFYGRHSFDLLARHLESGSPHYCMIGYVLNKTLSKFGAVARGLCRASRDGYLESVTEVTGILPDGEGAQYTDPDGHTHRLSGQETVSMNIFGFNPGIFAHLRQEFARFLEKEGRNEKAEFYIPAAVNAMVAGGRERLKVLRTSDNWFGVTHRQDRQRVVESIAGLVREGVYPDKLWS